MEQLRVSLILATIGGIVGALLFWTVWDWIVALDRINVGAAGLVVGGLVGGLIGWTSSRF